LLAVVEALDSSDIDGSAVVVSDGSDDTDAVEAVLTDGATVTEVDTEGLLVEVVLPVSVAVPIFDNDERGLCEFVVDCVGLTDGLLLTSDDPELAGDFVGVLVFDVLPV
jgi:hypothetical protein